ncbi:glycosyltransferase family 39 protein [Oscillatoria sp. CS-180]|uniref:glycosyltransferase family 39 protein n=1 Tax=Oscillatoria sp. CS-180 TaxID=3021720 RepID=UPI00232BCF88|nr:glycosyltransferase family 39 protein [Oscillatoria sp. CS-180]MDB9526651.1 glycosyltransferase family 39 protein [Oscillatoria sp. CS-180]
MGSVLRQLGTSSQQKARSHQNIFVLVSLFFLVGLGLRVMNLGLKTAWMDEVSTVIFSLGNSSYFLPTEAVVDLKALLQPITLNSEATFLDSARYLLQENNHPPAYFMLAHFWMDLFSREGAVASLAIARLFSALLGSLAIPCIFWAAKNTFQSSLAGMLSAAFMAVSPFSLFLSQEARHYGLAITLITLSLGCFVIAARSVSAQKAPDWQLCLGWGLVNIFAFANHYFSALTFCAEGIVIAIIAGKQIRQERLSVLWKSHWRPIYGAVSITTLGILAWLPVLLHFYGSPQTTFLRENGWFMRWFNPLVQTFAAFITTFVTPANFFAQTPLDFVIISFGILLTLLFIAKFVPTFFRGIGKLCNVPQKRMGSMLIGGFLLAILSLFAVICYVYGSDITRGLRYKFTYYPAVLILSGGIFAHYWTQRSPNGDLSISIPFSRKRLSGRRFVQLTWILGLLSSLLIVNNVAFPKYYAPDRFIPFVQEHSIYPVVLASTEKVHEQPTVIGARFLSIGWEIDRNFHPNDPGSGWKAAPMFFSIRHGYGVERSLTESFADRIDQIAKPADVWAIRSRIEDDDPLIVTMPESCRLSPDMPQGNKGGYLYVHLRCREAQE